MIDHEFRILTPSVRSLIKRSDKKEPILIKKILKKNCDKKFIFNSTIKYLNKAKLIKKIFFRGLPLNLAKNYFNQELEIEKAFKDLITESKFNIKGNRIIQIPNPDYVDFKKFKKFIDGVEKISGFELISSWHKKNTSDKVYNKFFEYIENSGLPVSIEVDYFYRNSFNNLYYFFDLIKKFPNIKYWLPHFGCGIFLHWEKVIKICRYKPKLLTSAHQSIHWLELFKEKKFKKIPIEFASDHPFNDLKSIEIYKKFKKFKNI